MCLDEFKQHGTSNPLQSFNANGSDVQAGLFLGYLLSRDNLCSEKSFKNTAQKHRCNL